MFLPKSTSSPSAASPWALVLSGGAGARLQRYVARRFGEARPKQYCAFSGSRTLVQQAVDRAALLTSYEQTTTVAVADHEPWVRAQLARRGRVLLQPLDRGTAAAVFLGLARIRARAPGAVVYLLPSHHVVEPEHVFLDAVAAAGRAAAAEPDRIVVVGVAPDAVETDYDYVEARSSRAGLAAAAVQGWLTGPSREAALAAIARGALWDTGIVAGSAEALWQAGRRALPAMAAAFDEVAAAIDPPLESSAINQAYLRVAGASFTRDVIAADPGRCLVVRMSGTTWCDFSRADRIERTETRLRRASRPAPRAGAA